MNTRAETEIERALARSLVFGFLSEETRHRLARSGQITALPAAAILCQKGDPGDAAWLVLEGALEVRTVSAGGRLVRLASLGQGEVAGEMAALDGEPRSADMVAVHNTRLLKISRKALIEALVAEPHATVALAEALSRRLRETDRALEALHLKDLAGRLASLLVAEGGGHGLVALTQGELAYRIGASREKVNRQLSRWRREGLIDVGGFGVRVLLPEQLAARAEGRGRSRRSASRSSE